MGTENFVSSRFKLSADFGFGDYVDVQDIVAVNCTMGLNTIPTMSLIMACGKNATTGKPATVHALRDNLKVRSPVTVTLTVTSVAGDISKMPSEKLIIFRGYYAGIGYQRSANSANYVIKLVHWLDDLNTASMANANFLPGAPYDFSQAAGGWAPGAPAEASGLTAMSTVFDPKGTIITASNIQEDLWGKVLRPILERIAEGPNPTESTASPGKAPYSTPKNEEVLAALTQMPANEKDMRLILGDTASTALANGIRETLAKTGTQTFQYATIWGKLVGEWAPQFMFAISPAAETARVVPIFGGLRWRDDPEAGFKTISADEYGYANFMDSTSQLLGGVEIFWPTSGSQSGGAAGAPNFSRRLGAFPPVEVRKAGAILAKEPPVWLCLSDVLGIGPAETLCSTGTTCEPIGDTTNPSAGTPPPDNNMARLKASDVAYRFAKQMYMSEVLQQRYGELSGKLRFDIAPGSTVKILPARHMQLSDVDQYMVAMVVQVSFAINAEQHTAGTSFAISNIRTDAEDLRDTFTDTTAPMTDTTAPMYVSGWPGGPLAEPIAP